MAVVENENWLQRLRSTDDVRDQAIVELQSILIRGLTPTLRHRGNKILPEDVAQEALLKILDKLDTFEGRSKFTTWAMTIAVRIATSEMRRKHFKDVSMDQLLDNSLQFEPAASSSPAEDNEDEKSKILSRLAEQIDKNLSHKQRDALHALLNGMPVEVFAEKTGSNRNAVYKLVHDARVKLRQGFEQDGFLAEDINSVFA